MSIKDCSYVNVRLEGSAVFGFLARACVTGSVGAEVGRCLIPNSEEDMGIYRLS